MSPRCYRATTGGSSGPWMTWPSSASASRPGSPETVSTGRPASSPLSSTSPHREDEEHRLRLQAAAHERQRLRGRSIEPLAVVDQPRRSAAPRWPPTGGSGPPTRPGSDPEPHQTSARMPLRALRGAVRGIIQPAEQRRNKLVKAGVRQLHLCLHAGDGITRQPVARSPTILREVTTCRHPVRPAGPAPRCDRRGRRSSTGRASHTRVTRPPRNIVGAAMPPLEDRSRHRSRRRWRATSVESDPRRVPSSVRSPD